MKKRPLVVDEAIRAAVLPLRIETTLASFKASVEADVVAAFDGWRGKVYMPAGARTPFDEGATAP